ncbi:TIM-barrel domain-containing protein [Meiothermus granaticius]|uniref:Oligosaccharide 4-alpha-D-glucosyltransferase n=1 Tax=Meiothermus granaticius NBRC 107808 TaxID=1227551 RepID=A0A399FDF9_9DEIN|nr:TIM-barrel domain-containing protein [Meiothermus granaticius]RIH92851.1 Oligosaccharide 4-alpha-D-glucosyltransferase [Meiothermus granaticius NBRC 107808]GEM85565.1 alpha-glucosidase [Meiothermus granaticius NBRC 107808]
MSPNLPQTTSTGPAGFRLERLTPYALRVTLGNAVHTSVLPELAPLPWEQKGEGHVSSGALSITWQPGPPALRVWYQGRDVLEDHPQVGYQFSPEGLRHTRVQHEGELYFGLGEVSGVLQRNGRRYRLEPRDACHYDPEFSDPLYKHIPLFITRHAEDLWSALLYDQPHPMVFDFGCERHHYHGLFTYTLVRGADYLRYLVISANSLPELLERMTGLIGRPELPPRWSLGYLASGMAYTDAPNPAERLQAFAQQLRDEGVPCDGFHLSSGYTLHEGKRYVFHWNRHTLPDPDALVAGLRSQGLRLIANIKPALLQGHPDYAALRDAGSFIRNRDGQAHVAPFWSGDASWLDFTHPQAREWWIAGVQRELLDRGIEGVWNDNNEYALGDEAFNAEGRPTYPSEQILGMAQASHQALQSHPAFQDKRPFLISRSASLGVQRLAQTWSGDNTSNWKNLRFGNPIEMGLALSGFAFNGNDVGGFFGQPPGPELFLRWVQQAVAYPRFSIHSWKEPPTEPWSYPEVFSAVKEALHLRYRLLPYLYSLAWQYTQSGAPIQRPLLYEFPDLAQDPGFHALLGPFLLFPSVGVPGQRRVGLELPGGWYDWHTGAYYQGTFEYPAPLERVPLLVREGAMVPLGPVMPWVSPAHDTRREVLLFPHRGEGRSRFVLYEDDGETLAYRRGTHTHIYLDLTSTHEVVELRLEARGNYPLPYTQLEVQLATEDPRKFKVISNWKTLEQSPRAVTLSTRA